ncbi:MAG: RHS repeat-associated core domain-containing protein, partial [Lachnospiraceae bacterium]|nr:RHS repeat-associated core domain-containing protein [Lachnospiraceae bacterium]
ITGIMDTAGMKLVSYVYDAWGKVTETNEAGNATGTQLIVTNPYTYRGYWYDRDSGLYYLQSRYYDPIVHRFLNADSYAVTDGGFLSYNMFAYCGNNPVIGVDPTGEFGVLFGAIIGGGIAGALIGAVSYVVSCGISDTQMTAAGMGVAVAVGAVSGAIGAAVGVAEKCNVVASFVVGGVVAVATAINTEGSVVEKVSAGAVAGTVAAVGTYIGTKIPIATENAFTSGFTAYTGTLMNGAAFEMMNVAGQQAATNIVRSLLSVQSPAANSATSSASNYNSTISGWGGSRRVAIVR